MIPRIFRSVCLGMCLVLCRGAAASGLSDLDRWEPVVLRFDQLPELANLPPSRVRVYAWRDGFEAIPFQLETLTDDGLHQLLQLVENARPLGEAVSPTQLILLAGWLGERAPPGSAPPCAGERLSPIPVARSGQTQVRGWVYLADCASDTLGSPARLLRYNSANDTVNTPDFQVGFPREMPMTPSWMSFVRPDGGMGEDILRGVYIHGEARLLAGLIKIQRSREDFRSDLVGWTDGPLLVARRTSAQARTIGEHYTGPETLTIESVLQPGRITFVIRLQLGVDLSSYLHDLRMTVAWQFCGFKGMHVRFAGSESVGVVDGVIAPAEDGLNDWDASWIYVYGPQGTVVGTLEYDSALPIVRTLHYQETSPADLELGYTLSSLQDIKGGTAVFRMTFLNVAGASLEDTQALMARRAFPLVRAAAPQ